MELSPQEIDYKTQLNEHTADKIVEALFANTNISQILTSDTYKEIIILFLFSGNPNEESCEFKIFQKIFKICETTTPTTKTQKTLRCIFIDKIFDNTETHVFKFGNNLSYAINIGNFAYVNRNITKILGENVFCIGIHPQHYPLPKIDELIIDYTYYIPRVKRATQEDIDSERYDMYRFFNLYVNRQILYVFRGNPESLINYNTEFPITNSTIQKYTFKSPIIIIFCTSESKPYINIDTVFKKGIELFHYTTDDENKINLNQMRIKDDTKYVFNDCPIIKSSIGTANATYVGTSVSTG